MENRLVSPRAYDNDYVTSLDVFAKDLDHALSCSFPLKAFPYSSVHVLLMRWDCDDLGVQSEIAKLRAVLEGQFNFDVEECHIPSLNATRTLQSKLYEFQDAHQSVTELLIVYYGGHAEADRPSRSIWRALIPLSSGFSRVNFFFRLLTSALQIHINIASVAQ